MHFDVAERAFPVAGVGNGGHRRYRGRGFDGDSCARRAFRVAGVGNGVTCCVAGHRFAWQAHLEAHPG